MIVFGTAWVTIAVIAYVWMGMWCGYEFGGAKAGLWFFWGIFPTFIVGGAPFAIYDLMEERQ